MDDFQFMTMDEMNEIYSDSKEIKDDPNKCPNCQIEMTFYQNESMLMCEKCGGKKNNIFKSAGLSMYSYKNYTGNGYSNNYYNNHLGSRSYVYEKDTKNHEESKIRIKESNIEKQYRRFFYQDNDTIINDDIILLATKQFAKIAKNNIIRGKNRNSLMAVCINYECLKNGKSMENKIIEIMGLTKYEFSGGKKKYEEFVTKGIIKKPNYGCDIEISINQYFIDLEINQNVKFELIKKYKKFVVLLSKLLINLRISSSSTIKSKLIASLYIFIILSGLKISLDILSEKCKISKTTIQKPIYLFLEFLKKEKGTKNYQMFETLFNKCEFDLEYLVNFFQRKKRKKRINN